MSPHELMDLAQQAATADMAMARLAAAQVQAISNLTWTLEERVARILANALWEAR